MTTTRPATTGSTRSDVGETAGPRILLYSDDRTVRESVRLAVGSRLGKGQPRLEWLEVATATEVVARAGEGWDLLVLDGEADKVGGMGLCRQLKNEIYQCPPVLVLTGRPQDAWLASWSLADDVVSRPLDAVKVRETVTGMLA
ncbi:response regulator transcription factor [Paraoerskovia marina]|uniref:response regulator transcription factor n=1 Tax=Paraoerskovia marina TaxID=545619 RepID=UPI0004927101|nr:response regulator transcription factor [Paraoerskovia marina]